MRRTSIASETPKQSINGSPTAQPDFHFLHRNMSLRDDDSLVMSSRHFLDAFCPLKPTEEASHSAYKELPVVYPAQIPAPPSIPMECPSRNFIMYVYDEMSSYYSGDVCTLTKKIPQ